MKTAVALVLLSLAAASPAAAQTAPDACPVSADHVVANDGLTRSRAAVASGHFTVLAVGSSSIEGAGASRRELGFVPLLEAGLERRLPGVDITVVNRGIGGETAMQTANRLEREIAATRPDLVIWQLGTNDVLRDRPMDDILHDLRRSEGVLERAGADILLIDPQRLPEATPNPSFKGRNPRLAALSRLIELEGGRRGYAVLRRFDAMGGWMGLERGGVGPDDLHLNDDGYACWAETTAEGLAAALR